MASIKKNMDGTNSKAPVTSGLTPPRMPKTPKPKVTKPKRRKKTNGLV